MMRSDPYEEMNLSNITRSIWLVAACFVVLGVSPGCERLGFETEQAPPPAQDDAVEPAEPEPWEKPPADWESPSTDLLVYDAADDEPTDEDAGPDAASLQASDTHDLRVVISKTAIVLENISALRVRTLEERQAMATRADDAGLDTIWQTERIELEDGQFRGDDLDGVFKLPAVGTYVDRVRQLESDAERPLIVALDLHRESPYSQIYSVTYSIWDTAPKSILLVRARRDTADGRIFAMARARTSPGNLGECDPTSTPCARPRVETRSDGLQVRAVPGIPADATTNLDDDADAGDADARALPCLPGQQPDSEGELPRFESEQDWTSRVVLLDEALCPSVPSHDDGSHDAAGLVELFNDIEAMAPGCTRATWTAGMKTTWESFGPVVGHAAAQTNFDEVEFGRPLPKTTPSPSCDDGLRPSPASER
jgi:hypothetical protein